MTREEAIKWMEEAIQDTNTYWDSCSEALQKELSLQIKNQEGNERILQNVFGTTKRPS